MCILSHPIKKCYAYQMETVVQSDIFFFITGVAVIGVTLVLVVAMVYIIFILKDIKNILGTAKKETQLIAEDIADLRENVKAKGMKISYLLDFIQNIRNRKPKKSNQLNKKP